jgi:hypothetical protein
MATARDAKTSWNILSNGIKSRIPRIQSYSEKIDFVKYLEFPNGIQPGIVHMDNKMTLTRLGTKFEN